MSEGRFEPLGLVAKEKVCDWQINECILGGLRFTNPERSDETVSAHKLEAAYLDDPSAMHLFPYRHTFPLQLLSSCAEVEPQKTIRAARHADDNCWL